MAAAALLVAAGATASGADAARRPPHAAGAETSWSTPLTANPGCPASGLPHLVFPTDKPGDATGPGALVWSAAGSCHGGGARVQEISATDIPSAPEAPRGSSGIDVAPLGPLSVASGPHGEIDIAGVNSRAGAGAVLIQGPAGGDFRALLRSSRLRAPGTLATAYLGDLAFAAPGIAGGLSVRVERFRSYAFGRAVPVARGGGRIESLTVAMDFRGEALLAWAEEGELFARRVSNTGRDGILQRLGPAGSSPHIAALLSDDHRGIVMWSLRQGPTTSIYVDRSAAGPRFAVPALLESFSDPAGAPPAVSSPLLTRLSSEGVLSAWTGVEAGRYVVRTAPIEQDGPGPIGTIALPGETTLAALASGPDAEVFLLLNQTTAASGAELWSARGLDGAAGSTFAAPQPIAALGGSTRPSLAVDPATGAAIAAWPIGGGSIAYSVRSAVAPR